MITITAATRLFCNSLSIFFIILVSMTVLTVGLPIPRQEHASESDLIVGEEFLSILMENSKSQHPQDENKPHYKEQQSSSSASVAARVTNFDKLNLNNINDDNQISKTSDSNANSHHRYEHTQSNDNEEGTVISVRVSSSVGHSMINKHIYTNKQVEDQHKDSFDKDNLAGVEELETNTELEDITISNVLNKEILKVTTLPPSEEEELVQEILNLEQQENNETDQEAIASEDAPSIVAEANKSEFHVDEVEPISRDYNPSPLPYQGTVIYHNEGSNNRARSVSYSTVIQTLPSSQKAWTPPMPVNNTMDIAPTVSTNPHHDVTNLNQPQNHNAPQLNSAAETKDYYVTSKYSPSDYNESIDKRNYETSSRYYSAEPTERNWGIPEQNYHEPSKPYTPIVYAQPEQNYEVDEAVSVETNGRAHGIQPVHPPARVQDQHSPVGTSNKKDDNQKVGYVVEGRNYRKYRVEERTSDGFIVGEYGVVRHDDGSLRGVRYTADGTTSPRLIYDALMKFLSL